jgi:hypothetical protein
VNCKLAQQVGWDDSRLVVLRLAVAGSPHVPRFRAAGRPPLPNQALLM